MAHVFWISVVFISFVSHFAVSIPGDKCGPPIQYAGKVLEEGYRFRWEFSPGDRVAYKCEHGFSFSGGSRLSLCQKGVWSRVNLQCKRKVCGSAGEIVNGRFSQTGNAFGATARAECDRGFVLRGESVRTCRANGWSGTVPTCVVSDSGTLGSVKCLTPKKSKNATYHGTKTTYEPGETVSFSCKEGFWLRGDSSVLQCDRSGVWNPRHANCHRVRCEKFNIVNGEVSFGHLTFNTKVNVGCRNGYNLKGPSVVTCAADGSWTPSPPTCEQAMPVQVTCPRPAAPNIDIPDGSKTEYGVGETVPISCQEGFEPAGSSQVTCGSDGQWQNVPECRVAGGKCQSPPPVPNAHTEHQDLGQYESNTAARYKCNHGYRMVRGPSSVYCRNGQWSDVQMTCEKKKCGSAGEILNGRYDYTGASFGDNATVQCDSGYFLVGVAVRHCTEKGWDGRQAECEAVQCPHPPRVPDADLIFDTSGIIKQGYMALYRCRYGTLIGVSQIYCTEDGTWSDPPPQCKVICPSPYVHNGVIVSGMRPQYQPRSSVMFRCNPGRKLLGSGVIKCEADGRWKPRLPHCV